MIKRLAHHDIQNDLWDEVVTNSDNPHIYLLSWYLDIVSPNWQGLICDDYKFVMPLTVKHKWGIPYLVQPDFCQKIRICGIGIKTDIAGLFYRKIFWQFPYFNLQIGDSLGLEKRKYLNGRINYTLDLSAPYKVLIKDYKGNAHRNINKGIKAGLKAEECSKDDFINFCNKWFPGITESQKHLLETLLLAAHKRNITNLIKVTDSNGEIQAVGCFLVWNMQILNIASATSDQGRKCSAMFLILDRIIRQYAETGYLLDFEGSMIPGVASFFQGFGAKASYYYHLKKYLFWYR